MNLFEHQSTISPNLPLRGFLYFAAQYKPIVEEAGYKLYSSKQIELPVPRYIIFYNGREEQEERCELRLSDAFIKKGMEGCLECVATVLNVNVGYNKKLHDTCKTLHDYAILIEKIRQNLAEESVLEVAVDKAVDDCIEHGILTDFLRKNRGEVKDMVLTTYDEQAHMEYIRQEAREDAFEEYEKALEAQKIEIQAQKVALQEERERNTKLLAELETLKKRML